MRIYDFNNLIPNGLNYGGAAGKKIGVTIDGVDYMLKFPGNMRAKNIKMPY